MLLTTTIGSVMSSPSLWGRELNTQKMIALIGGVNLLWIMGLTAFLAFGSYKEDSSTLKGKYDNLDLRAKNVEQAVVTLGAARDREYLVDSRVGLLEQRLATAEKTIEVIRSDEKADMARVEASLDKLTTEMHTSMGKVSDTIGEVRDRVMAITGASTNRRQ